MKYGLWLFVTLISLNLYAYDFDLLKTHVDTMQPGEWLELPNTKPTVYTESEVNAIKAEHGGGNIWGVVGSGAVIDAWSGAAFDGYRMWFFGGGHRGYGGNEVLEFDFTTLMWNRLTAPSPLTGENRATNREVYNCPEAAIGPTARHSYDGTTWNPVSNTVWMVRSGTAYCYDELYRELPEERKFWEFNPSTKEWKHYDSSEVNAGYVMSEWNPQTKRIVVIPKFYNWDTRGPLELDENGAIYRRGAIEFGVSTGNLVLANNYMYYLGSDKVRKLDLQNDPLTGTSSDGVIPQEFKDSITVEGGAAYHSPSDKLVYWGGKRDVFTFDLSTKKFKKENNDSSSTAPDADKRIFSKWIYLPELDVFAGVPDAKNGVWLYKLANDGDIIDPGEIRACINDNCIFKSVTTALESAINNDVVKILPGEWNEGGTITGNDVTVLAKDAILTGSTGGKGAIITQGDNITIDGLECKNITVPDGNGVCVRIEGKNLTLKNMYIHDNQQGLLSDSDTGVITIEDSLIENNGKTAGEIGREHGIYIYADTLNVKRTTIRSNFREGHELKSRSQVTNIEDSHIVSGEGVDSRTIDIPNGGIVKIVNTVIQHGENSANNEIIGYGHEGAKYTENSFEITNSTIVSDSKTNNDILFAKSSIMPSPTFKNNVIVGQYASDVSNKEENCYYNTRSEAGLCPYPSVEFDNILCNDTPPEETEIIINSGGGSSICNCLCGGSL